MNMEDGGLSPGTILGAPPYSTMDFDYMNELLLEGCWLETTEGSEFLHQNPCYSTTPFDPSFVWPALDPSNGDLRMIQRSLFADNFLINEPQETSLVNTQNMFDVASFSGQSENCVTEGSELSRRWWIGPRANPGPATSVMERLIWALGYIKDFTRDKDVLIQLWVPVNRGDRHVLTTHDQPFLLDPNCSSLVSYRDISVNYQFSAEEDSNTVVGLPGRVFLRKVPEWTPDVQFFRSDEYLRVNDAQRCDVRGTLALPVFEQGSRTCLGVIEVVSTRKINYGPEVERVCKALEAVDLRSSEPLNTQNIKECKESYRAALPEIQEVFRLACEKYRLPLAQTWVPCIQQGKRGSRHSDENYVHCISTVDHACYVADPGIRGFHEACSEHHLLKGQGIAGEAFMTNQPCFSNDITSFGKTEYPLSHHARMLGLRAAVAIRLRCIHTVTADFVLEFFLPLDCTDPEQQKNMLSSLSTIIQRVCQSLRVVTDKELEEETGVLVSEVIVPSDGRSSRGEMLKVERAHSEKYTQEDSSQNSTFVLSIQKERPRDFSGNKFSECRPKPQDSNLKGKVERSGNCYTLGEKRHTKAEKTITLQVLRQYFSGSLKDAAKSIGVCPTTLKRICRQHGINRWPSRKIKKVGHSLQKLQLVIDSVQGASGAFQIGSFYTNLQELASPNLSGTTPFSTSQLNDHPKSSSTQLEGGSFSLQSAALQSTSSSCSQSSSSSHCCSSGAQHLTTWNVAGGDMIQENSAKGALKRVSSDAGLRVSSQDCPKLLPRSQNHKSIMAQPNVDSHLPLPKNKCQVSQEGDAPRVKVTYGDENIRLRMQNNWRFKDLLQEIASRFNIHDASKFHLKYLDDDAEWVLLTCDDDLEECLEIYQSSQSHTIKLTLQVPYHHLQSSVVSSCP